MRMFRFCPVQNFSSREMFFQTCFRLTSAGSYIFSWVLRGENLNPTTAVLAFQWGLIASFRRFPERVLWLFLRWRGWWFCRRSWWWGFRPGVLFCRLKRWRCGGFDIDFFRTRVSWREVVLCRQFRTLLWFIFRWLSVDSFSNFEQLNLYKYMPTH